MRSSKHAKTRENVDLKAKVYLIIIAIVMIALCISNVAFIAPSIIVYTFVVCYTLWDASKRKGAISTYIEELTINVDSAVKNTLINSPFPIIILETDGNVVWKSSNFNKEFANLGIHTYIDDILKEITAKTGAKVKYNQKVKIGDKSYNVIGNGVKTKQKDKKNPAKYMTILYFLDVTSEEELFIKYENSQTCVGIIMIDNFEEVIQRIAPEEKAQVVASIEKDLYEWAAGTGGLMIETEKDTFVYVFDQKYLNAMKEEKFSILDKVKDIKTEDKLQLTLSIAISNEGESNYEKYESALVAMDIALGRGGDQAVIRQDEKYCFFGGRAHEVEKRTRVKARIIANALEELISEASNVMIMGHNNGDIDSFGSSLGLYRLAKTFEKDVYIVNNTYGRTLESFMESLEGTGEYKDVIIDKQKALSDVDENTLLIITDTHKKTYVEVPELLDKTEKIVVIDHHRKSADFIENAILSFHEAYASSASELVTEIIEYSSKDVVLEKIEAESLYAGIMVDTKNFTFKTGVRTFEAAAYLRKYGIDFIEIKEWFQSDLESYNLIADIVKKASITNDTIGISEHRQKDKNANLICAKAADELLTIRNITASFVLR
ncbi:MAG: DHH family phosphoesterase [Oscillospiraceae bacterium]|nr:DHH family phosphoesterase [Oscillospiraceae bacterium]